jgi:hypothetical protein
MGMLAKSIEDRRVLAMIEYSVGRRCTAQGFAESVSKAMLSKNIFLMSGVGMRISWTSFS